MTEISHFYIDLVVNLNCFLLARDQRRITMKIEKNKGNKRIAYEIPIANVLIMSNEDRFILTSEDDDSSGGGSSGSSGSGGTSWGPLTPLSLYPW